MEGQIALPYAVLHIYVGINMGRGKTRGHALIILLFSELQSSWTVWTEPKPMVCA